MDKPLTCQEVLYLMIAIAIGSIIGVMIGNWISDRYWHYVPLYKTKMWCKLFHKKHHRAYCQYYANRRSPTIIECDKCYRYIL